MDYYYLTCPSRGTLLHLTGFFHITIVFPILSFVLGFCSLCTNDNDFCLMNIYTLFFFNFWKQFFSWWPTIVYCIVVLCVLRLLFLLYFSENKLYMKLELELEVFDKKKNIRISRMCLQGQLVKNS